MQISYHPAIFNFFQVYHIYDNVEYQSKYFILMHRQLDTNIDWSLINQTQCVHQIQRLHTRVKLLWQDKKKYLISMKKSAKEITSLEKIDQNRQRQQLVNKMQKHIDRIMVQYSPVIQQLFQFSHKAKMWQMQSSEIINYMAPSSELLTGYKYATEIHKILLEATSFNHIFTALTIKKFSPQNQSINCTTLVNFIKENQLLMRLQRLFDTFKDLFPRRSPMTRQIKFLWQILPVSLLLILYTNHLNMMDQDSPFFLNLYDLRKVPIDDPELEQILPVPIIEPVAAQVTLSEL